MSREVDQKLGLRAAAILTIKNAADMTPKGRRAIARWLEKQKGYLLDYPQELSTRYTARYLYKS